MEDKQSKHNGSKTRPHRVEVDLTDEEFKTANDLAAKAGLKSLAQFFRKLLLHRGHIKAALTPDERKLITDLGKMGTNIWEIRKDLMKHGIDSKMISDLGSVYDEFMKMRTHYLKIIERQ